MKSIIHVNRQNIARNIKLGKSVFPTYIVRQGNKSYYGFAVKIDGPCTMIDPRKNPPLKCGARAWIETESPVKITGRMSYKEAMALAD
jgi:hypothetical protein